MVYQYQHQKKKLSDKSNTHYRTWKKGKNWCYSFGIMTVLAGGALLVSETTSADVTITTPSPTETSTADAPPAEVEAIASGGIETPAVTIEDSSTSVIDEIPAVETVPAAEVPEAETVPVETTPAVTEEVPVVEAEPVIAEEIPLTKAEPMTSVAAIAVDTPAVAPASAETAAVSTFSATAMLAAADLENLQVTFTNANGDQTLQDGDEIPLQANGNNYGVGVDISFSLDTTGYQAGDQITISRSYTVDGQPVNSTNMVGFKSFDVTEAGTGKVMGTISAVNGEGIVFTLSEDAIAAGMVNNATMHIPTVIMPTRYPTDTTYQITVGGATIDLAMPGRGFPEISPNDNISIDGDSQWISTASSTVVTIGVNNVYYGHIGQQGTPDSYTNATSGILTNISGNSMTKVSVRSNDYRTISFWSNGVLYYTREISPGVDAEDFLSGTNNNIFADASSKLNGSMSLAEAEAALSAGEWGAVLKDDGSGDWIWAYKTGNPSEGTIFDGEGFVAALQAAGVSMTAEDIAKTLAQSQFIATTHSYVDVRFADATVNGTAQNTMGNGNVIGSTVLPNQSSEAPGHIIITYYDGEDTSKPLSAESDAGATGTTSGYSTEETIKHYEDLGYILVSDSYSDAGTVTFDTFDKVGQYEVHFVHGTSNETETVTIEEVIHYVYEDGSTAKPDRKDSVSFTRTNTKDLVTNEVTSGAWTADNGDTTFDAVTSPEIENYTADQLSVTAKTGLTVTSSDVEETVTYKADMETTTETEEVTRTIHYVYEDGTEAAADSTDTVTFTREATKNLATGEITYSEWTAANDDTTFDAVTSPEIENYTADKLSVDEAADVTAESEDYEITVTYAKDEDEETPPADDPKDEDDTPADEPKDEDEETPVDEPKTPETPSPAPISFPAAPAAEAKVTKAVLPSTGDEHSSLLTLVGEVAVLGAVVFLSAVSRLRRKKH